MSKHQKKSGSPPRRAVVTRTPSRVEAKRPRSTAIFVNIDRTNVEVVGGRPDKGFPLTFIDRTTCERLDLGPKTVEAGVVYARENKGPKIITRFPTSAHAAGIHPNIKLLEYDHVLAIDTNSDPLTGKSVAILAWLSIVPHETDAWKIKLQFQPALVFRVAPGSNPTPNPEKIGWQEAIGRIMRTPELVGRVALFVDSCMNEIPAINARDRSILNDFMLPHEVTLFYATADAGASEFIGPLAIKSCDSVAKRLMKLSPMPPNIGQAFHFPIPVEALSDSAPRARRT